MLARAGLGFGWRICLLLIVCKFLGALIDRSFEVEPICDAKKQFPRYHIGKSTWLWADVEVENIGDSRYRVTNLNADEQATVFYISNPNVFPTDWVAFEKRLRFRSRRMQA